MGDHHEGDAGALLDRHQLELGGLAQLLVQRRQRLVEQQELGLARERPGQRHPLALAARDLVGPARGKRGELHEFEHPGHPRLAFGPPHPLVAQPVADVGRHRHVRKQRVGLEHHVHRPVPGRHAGHVLAVDENPPPRGLLEAREHPQQGGLAAARAAEEREDLAAPDLEADVADRLDLAEAPGHALDPHHRRRYPRAGHLSPRT